MIGNSSLLHKLELTLCAHIRLVYCRCLIFPNEKHVMLSALDAVVVLNNEAGASDDSLTDLLKGVSEERGKAAFEVFCFIMLRAWLPAIIIWQSFTTTVGLQRIEPHNL